MRDGSQSSGQEKRKYRRHPKPDEYAPEKPPSAYVLFSNKIREEVKNDNLSFTEIARLVGDRWQKLGPSQKEPFESHAASLKETYNLQLLEYKKTEHYKEYMQYLADFKAKHGPNTESKRPKLDAQQSSSSYSAASIGDGDQLTAVPSHARGGSLNSVNVTSHGTALPSAASGNSMTVPSLPNLNTAVSRIMGSSERGSPQFQFQQERRGPGQTSNQSSISEESGPIRAESQEAVSRTATLSLQTPPSNTPPLPTPRVMSGRPDYPHLVEHHTWSQRPGSVVSSQASPTSTGAVTVLTPLPPAAPSNEPWRDRSNDFNRPGYSTSAIASPAHNSSLSISQILGNDHQNDPNFNAGQRTLPPLQRDMSDTSRGQAGTFAFPQAGQSSESMVLRPGQSRASFNRSENEAAGTLADLAARQSMRFLPR